MSSLSIRQLTEADFEEFIALTFRTYPRFGMPLQERGIGFREEIARQFKDPSIVPMGLFVGKNMAAAMRLFHFDMNFFGKVIPVLGLGSLAVDLPFKKQGLAKQMIDYFHQSARDSGAFITALYPFSPSFYRRLGYGYGSRAEEYRLRLSGLPKTISPRRKKTDSDSAGNKGLSVRLLDSSNLLPLTDCYRRVFERNHGMFKRSEFQMVPLLGDGETKLSVGAFASNGSGSEVLAGYAAFHFVPGFDGASQEENIYLNDICVDELVYDSPEALNSLLDFFGRQADQAQHLILRSQDRTLYHLFDDPGDRSQNVIPPAFHQTSKIGVGLMYRIVDVGQALASYQEVRNWQGDYPVEVTTFDELILGNSGSYLIGIHSKGSRAPERVSANIRELSSLLMGAASARALSAIGAIEVTPEGQHPAVDALFPGFPEPICLSGF